MRGILVLTVLLPCFVFAQGKKTLDYKAYDIWQGVEDQLIANDGRFVTYTTKPNSMGNETLTLLEHAGAKLLMHQRASNPKFTNNSQHLIFSVSPDFFEQRDLERAKTKKEDMPKDTLAIYDLAGKSIQKIPNLKSFKVPKEWDNYVVYLFDPPVDTAKKVKEKKRSKKNGFDLAVRDLRDNSETVFSYVLDYEIAEEGTGLALTTTGNDSTIQQGVYVFDFETKSFEPIFRAKGEYHQLTWSKSGDQFSFISDTDTTKALQRDYSLHYWTSNSDSAATIASNATLSNLNVNHEFNNYFSESGKRMFFQTKNLPVVKDTTLLKEEIVDVEVWHYKDAKLFTQQENNLKDDLKLGYLNYYDPDSKNIVQLGASDLSNVEVSDEGDGAIIIGLNNYPYRRETSWEGFPGKNDLFVINPNDGSKTQIGSKIRGFVSLSPKGKYAYWFDYSDTVWVAYSFEEKAMKQLTDNSEVPFYNELHDSPSDPNPYGVMSWTENDDRVLIYDRYDVWEVDPKGTVSRNRITPNGRSKKITYRYQKLDREERFIKKNQKLILAGFNEEDKSEAIYSFQYGKNRLTELASGDYSYNSFLKAKDSKNLIFTKENFQTFPNLLSTDISFSSPKQVSDINPQQSEYNWGTSELVYWRSLDGVKMEGMLFKPENFDPNKKYPMLVNFYEKSSNRLNSHRDPFPGRSTINYSYYTSRGYIIFNPNVNYRTGYPGESAYNCVIPGVTSLIEKGFVDEENIGVQGHSWGGYQIAHLLTKTDMFKCAEAGAPVVNMISAYGGIRWGSGFSRMFQYEHTQSRIGGNLWEYPMRYIENSPIFQTDKVNTPVLILHNDADGAVPWYQGIEYFVSLRRLNKPAWMLNYRGEPHWPVKVQNRIDFNRRVSQFFDYYLKGAQMPKWMKDGVPATETGINQGYELTDQE